MMFHNDKNSTMNQDEVVDIAHQTLESTYA